MYPFRNILFPTDFTPHARAALKYAAAFAHVGAGRVLVFSVQGGSVPANLLTVPVRAFDEPEQHWLRQLRDDVSDVLADPLLSGLDVEPVIIEGEPALEIARAAREFEIDLVTVVTHGRKGLARALWGSTAEEIIAESPCPVLTLRPPQRDFVEHRDGRTQIRVNRLLLATTFRQTDRAAEQMALHFAESTGAELHVIYVISDYLEQMSDFFPESGGSALNRFRAHVSERMAGFSNESGKRTQTHVAEGRPYEQIVRVASEKDVDLIVMGSSVHLSIFGGTPILGSEIERVVRNSPCPVLSVPSGKILTPIPALVSEVVPQT